MGGYAKFCIESLFGWVKSLFQQAWAIFSNQKGGNLLSWISENWKGALLALCILGAAADLLVYLFRWEPMKVWKSYMNRRKHLRSAGNGAPAGSFYSGYDLPGEEPEGMIFYEDSRQLPQGEDPEYPPEEEYGYDPEEIPAGPPSGGPLYSAPNMPVPAEYQAMYRRPEQKTQVPEYDGYDPDPRSMTERNLEKVIGPRRKKLRVNELFRDTEEAGFHYEAPKPVIDQTEAYNAPVFPRKWKDNGEDPS